MKRSQDIQRTAREIVLPDSRRISTLYKDDFPGGEGPVLLTARSVWWGTREMVFRADLATGKREVYLPWAGGKGVVQALELDGDAVRVRQEPEQGRADGRAQQPDRVPV